MDLNFKDNYNDKFFGVEIVDFLNAAESNKLVIDLNKKQYESHCKITFLEEELRSMKNQFTNIQKENFILKTLMKQVVNNQKELSLICENNSSELERLQFQIKNFERITNNLYEYKKKSNKKIQEIIKNKDDRRIKNTFQKIIAKLNRSDEKISKRIQRGKKNTN